MMNKIVKGLVLRNIEYKENDIILSLFTEEYGIIPVICRGVRRLRKRPAVYCQLFCYSEFNLFIGKNMDIVDSADVIEHFYNLRNDIEALSLAQYLADICMRIPEKTPDFQTMRLILNSLSLLCSCKIDYNRIKLVFELQFAAIHGFAPKGTMCSICGDKAEIWMFDSGFVCKKCAENKGFVLGSNMINDVNSIAWGTGLYPYKFVISDVDLNYLSKIASEYIKYQFDCTFDSLEFYKKFENFDKDRNMK